MEPHDFAQADGHVGVAREIEIELHGVGDDGDPGSASAHGGQIACKQCVHLATNHIRNQNFLGKPYHKAVKTLQTLRPALLPVADFVRNVAVAHNGAGDELGEHDDVEHIVGEPLHRLVDIAVGIDHVGDGLEREKGDADGQQHLRHRERLQTEYPEKRIQVLHEEVRILEIAQKSETDRDGQSGKDFSVCWVV